MAKTHNVNLTKALAEIRQWPGARTDRKVFKVIADYANDKGVCTLLEAEIADIVGMTRGAVFTSVNRLAIHGLTTLEREETPDHYQLECTIARRYMRSADGDDTDSAIANLSRHLDIVAVGVLAAEKAVYAQGPEIAANTERIQKLEKRLDDLAQAIKKATNSNN